VATSCGHLYCLSCAQTIIESEDSTCAICSQVRLDCILRRPWAAEWSERHR
jgi:hypothetical protein